MRREAFLSQTLEGITDGAVRHRDRSPSELRGGESGRDADRLSPARRPQPTPKDSVFLDQIRQHLLLPMIQPANERSQQNSQEKHVHHGGRVYPIDQD